MSGTPVNHALPLRHVGECWKGIGVYGDRSCGLLEEHVHCRNCPVFTASGRLFFQQPAPPGYEAQWTQKLRDPEEVEPAYVGSVLVFRVGAHWLGLKLDAVAEVAQSRRIARIPHRSGRVLLGLANIRGELLLCASLRGLFDLEVGPDAHSERPPPARMIVVQRQRAKWVVPVDEVAGVRPYAADQLAPVADNTPARLREFCLDRIGLRDHAPDRLDDQKLWAALEGSVA